ncbi:hypothetical protein HPB48_012138 [Haemaphysalis longicornis]|uniref:Uncharacterized protein n=1 Tax=Haemaphysalis longicornis TaxID=44386 RepID=A0A9J6FQ72_HAELO|nr:hypothetical protein HPB48_012138 [Haemaphysalis longicornis]
MANLVMRNNVLFDRLAGGDQYGDVFAAPAPQDATTPYYPQCQIAPTPGRSVYQERKREHQDEWFPGVCSLLAAILMLVLVGGAIFMLMSLGFQFTGRRYGHYYFLELGGPGVPLDTLVAPDYNLVAPEYTRPEVETPQKHPHPWKMADPPKGGQVRLIWVTQRAVLLMRSGRHV